MEKLEKLTAEKFWIKTQVHYIQFLFLNLYVQAPVHNISEVFPNFVCFLTSIGPYLDLDLESGFSHPTDDPDPKKKNGHKNFWFLKDRYAAGVFESEGP